MFCETPGHLPQAQAFSRIATLRSGCTFILRLLFAHRLAPDTHFAAYKYGGGIAANSLHWVLAFAAATYWLLGIRFSCFASGTYQPAGWFTLQNALGRFCLEYGKSRGPLARGFFRYLGS
ncbi:hypothetical protein D3Y59_00580 [Hymenobacter oligotrophus]|uniref:Uncharacterized protein n=1 Tax=Hymenobacter oligotrophus TaxID=2319843 RepID=A0A3B7R7N9_9BACT|nr:hypothetical protein D3Y59_00580 [Hymenobacter oligotrophus]